MSRGVATFDTLTPGTSVGGQYTSIGALFSSGARVTQQNGLFPAYSAPNVALYATPGIPFVVRAPQTPLWSGVGGYITPTIGTTVQMVATGVVGTNPVTVGSVSTIGYGTNQLLEIHGSNILRVDFYTFDRDGHLVSRDFALDNFFIDRDVPPTPDLDVEGLSETDEDAIGGLVVLSADGNNAPRVKISIAPSVNGTMLANPGDRVRIFDAPSGGRRITFNGTDNVFANTTSPVDLYVEGSRYSDLMRDVTITLNPLGSNQDGDSVTFTVLWADQPTVATFGTISLDNDKRDHFGSMSSRGYQLGLLYLSDALGTRIGWGTEASTIVHPNNFSYPGPPVHLSRDAQVRDWYGNGRAIYLQKDFGGDAKPSDSSFLPTRDDTPSSRGVIYDLDAPGVLLENAPAGEVIRSRNNFRAFATILIGSTIVRASPVREYFVDFSIRQLDAPRGKRWVVIDPADVKKDRRAGNGVTKLTWDLQ